MGQVYRVDGPETVVLKTHPSPPPGLFPTEAFGLRRLAAVGVRVPEVLYEDEAGLVLSWLPPGEPDWRDLAEQLARLHTPRDDDYGSHRPVFLGNFGLPAGESSTWKPVWADLRVRPLLEACRPTLGPVADDVETLLERVDPPEEAPCLVHGDLWSGNVHMSTAGAALIDPSVQVAERALDLAMMRLFGGFPPAFWSIYTALRPIPDAVEAGIHLHQLTFLLVHVHFFGQGYVSGVQRIIQRYS